MMTECSTIRRKRLLHQARYRGCLESDLLMGRFATQHLGEFDERQLDRFEALLNEADQDVLAWVSGRATVPEEHNNDVFLKLMTFDILET
ncbi:MAG: succinate dehydrogenase assembly factor 2 [Pseudomonadota bacterium]